MSNQSSPKPFDFSQFVPGFEFLKNLGGRTGGSAPGMPGLSSWIAPTLSVEEVDRRIQELKAVQFWLEQNGHALKATIQALEVQKMTLSTLRSMNVQMEDLANAFTRSAGAMAAAPAPAAKAPLRSASPTPAPAPAPATPAQEPAAAPVEGRGSSEKSGDGVAAGSVIDPLQWWGALTQQFQQIAGTALQDAAKLGVPLAGAVSAAAKKAAKGAAGAKSARGASRAAAKKTPAAKRAGAARGGRSSGTRRSGASR